MLIGWDARADLRGSSLEAAIMERSSAGFRKELVSRLLHLHFRDDKTKGVGATSGAGGKDWQWGNFLTYSPFAVSGDALQLMAELLRIFVVEAAIRGVRQAQAEDMTLVDVDQLEKVLPQLLLDF
ncbi:centromere protein X isoform X1 [Octodon degus]|uniref:Centromere protein X n=1 Tax=Octodon degus TaxID=10160 RepID=A0A6P6D4Z9_OCTDE|nr:centromere protein X isoform X1 [Octodon degus]